jgi:hypothetical protein
VFGGDQRGHVQGGANPRTAAPQVLVHPAPSAASTRTRFWSHVVNVTLSCILLHTAQRR